MSTDNNGGPAFPIPLNPGQTYTAHATCDGMTLRDYFAAKALAEFLRQRLTYAEAAEAAYKMADAMLRARRGIS